MRTGIIGNGIVGRATAKLLPGSICYDIDPSRCTASLPEVLACDLRFVCLPTPARGLHCDTSALDAFFAQHNGPFILRSTVPIGYTEAFPGFVHFPDFHTERLNDADKPNRFVIGYEQGPLVSPLIARLEALYPQVRRFYMSTRESEATKLIQNAFSAVKIAFFNEVASVMTPSVMDALLAGGWINPMHTQVPGPDGLRGFGGACLSKDLANLAMCLGPTAIVCLAALTRNNYDRSAPAHPGKEMEK